MLDALADGRITPAEAARVDAELAEMMAAGERLRRQLADIRAGGR
jgi:anti-sigma factor RsiW